MSRDRARDWSQERWVKQHVHEPLYELVWPLMQRAMRDYLRKRAEPDGTLVVDQDEPVEALLRVLGTHEPEIELAREAILGLIGQGILVRDARSIWMPERPESQARLATADGGPLKPAFETGSVKRTSTERVREHRRRKRLEHDAFMGVSPDVSRAKDGVSPLVPTNVSGGVSLSRDDSHEDPLFLRKDQKRLENHHQSEESGARGGVPISVSDGTPPTPGNERESRTPKAFQQPGFTRESRVSQKEPLWGEPASFADALQVELQRRAALVVDRPTLAEKLRPDQWPEVQEVAAAFARARNEPRQPIGRYAQDSAVQLAVALYAAGYLESELVHVVTTVANQDWAKGRGLGSLLTFRVVNANRPRPPAKTEAKLSPRAAEALALARSSQLKREAG